MVLGILKFCHKNNNIYFDSKGSNQTFKVLILQPVNWSESRLFQSRTSCRVHIPLWECPRQAFGEGVMSAPPLLCSVRPQCSPAGRHQWPGCTGKRKDCIYTRDTIKLCHMTSKMTSTCYISIHLSYLSLWCVNGISVYFPIMGLRNKRETL